MSIARALSLPTLLTFSLFACFDPKGTGDEVSSESESTTGESTSESTSTESTSESTSDESTSETTTETGGCTALGCDCDGSEGSCDPGLVCLNGSCAEPVCGNAITEGAEQCDDGNAVEGDGCDPDCTYTEVLYVDSSYQNVCVLIEGGRVRCWGKNNLGQLGYGHTDDIGDDETPAEVGDVMLPEPGVELTMGDSHSCVLLADDAVRCWGQGSCGKLGYGNTNNIGDDETPASAGDVAVGGAVTRITAGGTHTCARLDDGAARCWGNGANGRLGYGNTNLIGDNEVPATAGDVAVGSTSATVDAGGAHSCSRLPTGAVRCWGLGSFGGLGYGAIANIGDNELPSTAGNVQVF